MRASHSISAALGLCSVLLVCGTAPGRADETFMCEDGSSVTIDSSNRAVLQDHPCVKAWFADDLARRKAQVEQGAASSGPGVQPVVHRYTLRRAAALRDLRQRPAYLAWSRARTVQVRSYARSNGTVVGAHVRSPPSRPLGVTIRVPASRR
jgi:hypothetical protein